VSNGIPEIAGDGAARPEGASSKQAINETKSENKVLWILGFIKKYHSFGLIFVLSVIIIYHI